MGDYGITHIRIAFRRYERINNPLMRIEHKRRDRERITAFYLMPTETKENEQKEQLLHAVLSARTHKSIKKARAENAVKRMKIFLRSSNHCLKSHSTYQKIGFAALI